MNIDFILDKYKELKLYEDFYNYKYEPIKIFHLEKEKENSERKIEPTTEEAINNPYLAKKLFDKKKPLSNNQLKDRLEKKIKDAKVKFFEDPIINSTCKSPYFFPWCLDSKLQRVKETKPLYFKNNQLMNVYSQVKTIKNNYDEPVSFEKPKEQEKISENDDDYVIKLINKFEENNDKIRKTKSAFHLCNRKEIKDNPFANESKVSYPFKQYRKFTNCILYVVNNLPQVPKEHDIFNVKPQLKNCRNKFIKDPLTPLNTNDKTENKKTDMTSEFTKSKNKTRVNEIFRKNINTDHIYEISKPYIPSIREFISKNMKKRITKPVRLIASGVVGKATLMNYFKKFGVVEYCQLYNNQSNTNNFNKFNININLQ